MNRARTVVVPAGYLTVIKGPIHLKVQECAEGGWG